MILHYKQRSPPFTVLSECGTDFSKTISYKIFLPSKKWILQSFRNVPKISVPHPFSYCTQFILFILVLINPLRNITSKIT